MFVLFCVFFYRLVRVFISVCVSGTKSRYVDVLNSGRGSSKPAPSVAPPADLFAPLAPMAMPANLFVPSAGECVNSERPHVLLSSDSDTHFDLLTNFFSTS